MNRAYSVIEVKSYDEDSRVITGIATTPKTDRMGDIVEPEGAEYKLPIPLLWQHRSDSPIGHVTGAKVTKAGIQITARIEREDEPGELKNLLDKAWQSIRKGLVRGLSIGFAPIEAADIKGTWAQRFIRWEWLELSAVTIPANVDATILTVKQYDRPAASGNGRSLSSPGVPGITVKSQPGDTMSTIAERIAGLEAARESKRVRLEAINKAAEDEGRTKNETEREEYGTLVKDIEAIDQEIGDQKDLERIATRAKPVDGTTAEKAGQSRDTRVVVNHPAKLEPGIEFARFAMCVAAAKGNTREALELAKTHYPQQQRAIRVLKAAGGKDVGQFIANLAEMHTKADVPAGTTVDDTWAGPLVAHNEFTGDFVEFLRARTIIGQLDLRRIPFNVHIKGQTTGGSAHWTGEGQLKPVTKFDFNDAYHGFKKVAGISVLTDELIRFSNPSAERLVRDSLAETVIARLDTDLFDTTAESSTRPAGLLNNTVANVSAGVDFAAVMEDIKTLWAPAIAANLPMTSARYVTTPSIALGLSLMTGEFSDRPQFPGMTMSGGTLNGVPVLVSNYIAAGTFILVFQDEVYLSDDGVVTVDASREASIQMVDEADGTTNASSDLSSSSPAPVPTTLVSMFQTNSVALRAERYINWSKRRSTAVQRITSVAWGSASS